MRIIGADTEFEIDGIGENEADLNFGGAKVAATSTGQGGATVIE